MQVKVTVDLTLHVPDNDKANQVYVVQELLDKLYVGTEHYEDDIFSVVDLTLTTYRNEND